MTKRIRADAAGRIRLVGGQVICDAPDGTPVPPPAVSAAVVNGQGELLVTITGSIPSGATHYRGYLKGATYQGQGSNQQGRVRSLPLPGLVTADTGEINFGLIADQAPSMVPEPDTNGDVDYSGLNFRIASVDASGDTWHRNSRPIPIAEAVVIPDLVEEAQGVLSAALVGDTFVDTPPSYNITPAQLDRFLEEDDGGGYDEIADSPTAETAGSIYRRRYEAVGPNGDILITYSLPTGVIGSVSSLPEALGAGDVVIESSAFDPGAQTDTWINTFSFPNHDVGEVQWTRTNPEVYPNDADIAPDRWEPMDEVTSGIWALDHSSDPLWTRFALTPGSPNLSNRWIRFRWRETPGVGDFSPVSVRYDAEPPDVSVPVVTSGAKVRPYLKRHLVGAGQVDIPGYYDLGAYSGDVGQWFSCGCSAPDGSYYLTGGDMNGIRIVFPGGIFAYPLARGLPHFHILSIEVDPADPNTWVVLAGAAWKNENAAISGIWISRDRGMTVTLRQVIPNILSQSNKKISFNLARFPRTGGNVLTAQWSAVANVQTLAGAQDGARFVNFTIGQAGTNNARVSLPYGTYGWIYGLMADPTVAGRLYMMAEGGFYRSTDGGSTWSKAFNNLPAGQCRSGWINPGNNQHIIVSITSNTGGNQGIWETTNGATFVRILADDVHFMAVGAQPASGQRTIYALMRKSGNNNADVMRYRNRSGTWLNASRVTTTVDPTDTLPLVWAHGPTGANLTGGQHFTYCVPSATNPDEAFLQMGQGFTWRTDTGGASLIPAWTNFGGIHGHEQGTLAGDPDIIVKGLHDQGIQRSLDGGVTVAKLGWPSGFKERAETVLASNGVVAYFAFYGGYLLQNDASITAARRRRFIGAAGHPNQGQVVVTVDYPYALSGWRDFVPEGSAFGQSNTNGAGRGQRRTGGYLPTNFNKCWIGFNKSIDAGQTWTSTVGKASILGAGASGDQVYMWNGSNILYSTDFGASVSNTLLALTNANMNDGQPVFCWSEIHRTRGFFKHPLGVLVVNHTGGSSMTQTVVDLSPIYGGTLPSDFLVIDIEQDDQDYRYLHVLTETVGGPCLIRVKFLNTSYSAWTMEDMTGYGLPTGAQHQGLHKYRGTGNTGIEGGIGEWVLEAPADWNGGAFAADKNAVYNNLPLPLPECSPVGIAFVPIIADVHIVGDGTIGFVCSISFAATGNPRPSLTYQWKRNGSNISGATSATYTTQAADDNTTLTCTVTATNSAGVDVETTPGMAIT